MGLGFSGSVGLSVPDRVRGDRRRIGQILTNLLDNAVKFTEKGRIRVTVREEKRTGHSGELTLRFAVADTGIGVPEFASERLFTKFTQLDPSSTRKYGGTGLGLAISRELAELMGGTAGAVSPSGLPGGGPGAEFWFTVKVLEASSPAGGRKTGCRFARKKGSAAEGLKNLRILAVEDKCLLTAGLSPPCSVGRECRPIRREWTGGPGSPGKNPLRCRAARCPDARNGRHGDGQENPDGSKRRGKCREFRLSPGRPHAMAVTGTVPRCGHGRISCQARRAGKAF